MSWYKKRYWRRTDGIVFVLGADTSEDGNELGPESMARCNKAIEVARYNFTRPCFVLNAGYNPNIEPQPQHTMAELMKQYIESKLDEGYLNRTTFELDKSWGTVDEVGALIFVVRMEPFLPEQIIVISSWYHIPRIWLIFQSILGNTSQSWNIAYEGTWEHVRPKYVLLESFKLIAYWIRCVFGDRLPELLKRFLIR